VCGHFARKCFIILNKPGCDATTFLGQIKMEIGVINQNNVHAGCHAIVPNDLHSPVLPFLAARRTYSLLNCLDT